EKIYREGDPADAFYCIVSGKARLFVQSDKGTEETIEYVGRGTYFGIISLLSGEPHSVTAEVINDAVLLKIDKKEFEHILKRIPSLALHFSQTLSRRLKKKNLHHKTIFESTILSVFSLAQSMDRVLYALNLSCSLKKETGKRVLFLSVISNHDHASENMEFIKQIPSIELQNITGRITRLREAIVTHGLGFDILKIKHTYGSAEEANQIVTLLNYLTEDYHYIVVDLSTDLGDTATKALAQSDIIHLISDAQKNNLQKTLAFLKELQKKTKRPEGKISLLAVRGEGNEKIEPTFEEKIYATISQFPLKDYAGGIVMHHTNLPYSRTIRRIAREIGEVTIGLALGCGAASGLAHIGVIKALERENIPIDVVVGSSMGALLGSFWAVGMSSKEMARIFVDEGEQITGSKLLDFTFPKLGLIAGKKMEKFLRRYLGDRTFHDVKFSFKVMATNLRTKEEVVLDKGSIVKAVRTSIAIPGILTPVRHKDQFYLDGGILNPIPVGPLVKRGISKIIAVNILPVLKERKGGLGFLVEKKAKPRDTLLSKMQRMIDRKIKRSFSPNIFDVIVGSLEAMEYVLAEQACQQADIVIHPEIEPLGWFDFVSAQELITLAEEETMRLMPEIKSLIGQ
ncbi:patatin-like phospholipase family protein, partial [Candidatus Omnitrophota bacterium]